MLRPGVIHRKSNGTAAALVACLVVILVLLGVFGLYYLNTNDSQVSTSMEVSSLRSLSSQDSGVIVSQQSTISCLQSEVRSLENSSAGASTSSSVASTCVETSGAYRTVNMTATLLVPSGAGPGTLTVTVWDGSSVPIASIFVNVTSSGLVAQSGYPVFKYNGQPVSVGNPVPEGATVSGNATLLSGGTTQLYDTYSYTFQVTVTFEDGVMQSQSLSVKATI